MNKRSVEDSNALELHKSRAEMGDCFWGAVPQLDKSSRVYILVRALVIDPFELDPKEGLRSTAHCTVKTEQVSD
jgi:hypothetical protein